MIKLETLIIDKVKENSLPLQTVIDFFTEEGHQEIDVRETILNLLRANILILRGGTQLGLVKM